MQNNKLISNLASIGRRFIGTPERKRAKYLATSAYYAPNGDREVRRRLRQEIRALAKRAIEVLIISPSGGNPYSHYTSVWDQLTQDPENYEKLLSASRERLLEIRNNLLADLEGAPHVS